MKFKSKTELAEHMKHLVKDGYLHESWGFDHDDKEIDSRKWYKIYTINFDKVKTDGKA